MQRPMLSALTTSPSTWTTHPPTSTRCQSPQEGLVVIRRSFGVARLLRPRRQVADHQGGTRCLLR
jgi:hypothetical protein